MAEAGKRLSRILNIVHNDEIWKDHVRHEHVSARHKWPDTWGYLIYEYKKLNNHLAGKPISPRPPSNMAAKREPLKLPAIPKKSAAFPKTTSQEIGWTSDKDGHYAMIVYNFGDQKRGKCTIERRLCWPKCDF